MAEVAKPIEEQPIAEGAAEQQQPEGAEIDQPTAEDVDGEDDQQEAQDDGYDQDEEQEKERVDEPSVEEPATEETEDDFLTAAVEELEISELHETFSMDKKYEDDPTLGMPNNKHLLCQLCEVVIIPEMFATKVKNEVDLIKNTLREYDICDTYWHVESLERF